jgi:SAM-dependent methyltransferase
VTRRQENKRTTSQPSPWVERHAGLIRPDGEVLDLACGNGRHARYLASLHKRVTAVDIDVSGAAALADQDRIEVIAADLEQDAWPLAKREFDGVVVVNYLYRPHFPLLIHALRDGGVLIFDTFARGHEKFGRPRNPAFLLEPGELLAAFSPSLSVIAYDYGEVSEPERAVRQRLCAIKERF